jgi:hypothetical protein
MRSQSFGLVAALLALLPVAAAFGVACSNSASNPVPVYNVGGDSGGGADSADARESGTPGDSSTPSTDSSQPPPGDAQPADASEASVDAAGCATDAGCWSCTPSTTGEFLNQCTASQCTPFNNLQRLPDYDGGALPPLQ